VVGVAADVVVVAVQAAGGRVDGGERVEGLHQVALLPSLIPEPLRPGDVGSCLSLLGSEPSAVQGCRGLVNGEDRAQLPQRAMWLLGLFAGPRG
jgi:hypothetical protein